LGRHSANIDHSIFLSNLNHPTRKLQQKQNNTKYTGNVSKIICAGDGSLVYYKENQNKLVNNDAIFVPLLFIVLHQSTHFD